MFDIGKYIVVFERAFQASDDDMHSALAALKAEGATAVTAVLVLKRYLDLSTQEADDAVLQSRLWDSDGALILRKSFNSLLEEE
ncbi:hypothetical protein [Lewinella sp. IMCC34191]|uniref:hypothetical protein n=1 Tax=Lewinella sp. IMCC34191 TaxID=2259172 RepID=UPI000E230DFA|nr:hypothetical protein [Lewinella sp. IMCC34191]